jgi:hypothetical protein
VTHRHVFDPPVWCGAATTALCGDEEILLRGKLRCEGGIKVTGRLGMSLSGRVFVASQKVPQKRLGDREAILFVSASTTWINCGLPPTDTTG